MAPQVPYFPDDPIEIFFPNGGTQAVQLFVWDTNLLKPILWDGKVTFSGSISIGTVDGDKTNNNAPPSTDNFGVLGAVANAAHPTWTEGNLVLLSVDLNGNLRTVFSGSLPTGSNVIGHVITDSGSVAAVTNAGTFAVQESQKVTPYFYIAAASSNQDSQVVKNSAGTVHYISVFSTITSARFIKLYNKSTGPTSSDTPVYVAAIPANTTGAGSNLPIPLDGIDFSAGISHRITTGVANNDTGAASANDAVINIGYR